MNALRSDIRCICLGLLVVSCIIGLVQHSKHLTKDIIGPHNWRQSQTMWNVRNFHRQDANILNTRVSSFNGGKDNLKRYEFPVMQWSIAMLQHVFGEHIAFVRICMFLVGMMSLFGMFFLVHHFTDNWWAALFSAAFLQYSPVFYYYMINPLPDVLALGASIWYLYFVLEFIKLKKNNLLVYAGLFLLLATCAKLQYLMFSIVSVVFFIQTVIKERKISKSNIQFGTVQLLILVPALCWYAWVMPGWEGNPILEGSFSESATLKYYLELLEFHAIDMIPYQITHFPAWVLILSGLSGLILGRYKLGLIWPIILITVFYLLSQLIPIGKIHDYYLFPLLTWIYLLLGIGAANLLKYSKLLMIIPALLLLISMYFTPAKVNPYWTLERTVVNPDLYNNAEDLREAVPQDAHCIMVHDNSTFIFSYLVDKMGHTFKNSHLPTSWIDDMIRNYNVRYMYSDVEEINSRPDLQPYLDNLIMQRGSVKVFKLKIPDDTN